MTFAEEALVPVLSIVGSWGTADCRVYSAKSSKSRGPAALLITPDTLPMVLCPDWFPDLTLRNFYLRPSVCRHSVSRLEMPWAPFGWSFSI